MQTLSKDKCLDFMVGILKILKSTSKPQEVFSRVVDVITRVYHCQSCAVVLIDPKTEYLRIETSEGISNTFQKSFHRQISTGSVGSLLWEGKPIYIAESSLQPELAEELQLEHPFGSCVCAQITADHRSLGYLYVACNETNRFDEGDIQIVQACADLAGVAYYKAWLSEENLRLDRVDHETGLEKYHAFQERLVAEAERAAGYNEQFSVFICDVDNFKKIGKTYGYQASQQTLREMGSLLKGSLRSIDAGGRYGPDEFILLRANEGEEEAVRFAQELCRSVDAAVFTSKQIKSSISVGVAVFPQNGTLPGDIVLTAKKALFEAQRQGRNTVVHLPAVWYEREHVHD
jgi:diguanylate cyclase (GGDEF)-like protein